MSDSYKKSGVDIDAGNKFVNNIKDLVKSTHIHGVISEVGGYGALFAPNISEMKEPVLVSGTDGVGTKLKIAIQMKKLDTIGIDLVAMCVNDIGCLGAKPLFFLDYLATSKLEPELHADVVKGIAEGCKMAKCALIGGETAEMPDFYKKGDFDIAGFSVGIIDREKIIDGTDIGVGNVIVGFHSTGPHSNGYSLINKVIKDSQLDLQKKYEGFEESLGEALLAPTKIYSHLIENLRKIFNIKGIAHITGGGFWENIPRILPRGVQAVITKGSWEVPHIFRFIQKHSNMDEEEMFRVFNCGIGMVLIVDKDHAEDLTQAASTNGIQATIIGETRIMPENDKAIIME
ncbi:MAG: phosphoribosylformylglycinamidine cyclo-ligase [Deltaproteobacteria bacterium]|nr:phosphoribosylformylglycinamidine cyclo-ligase [Deltaproteobacteria bacterium]